MAGQLYALWSVCQLHCLPQIDSKEVEDVFQGVLRDQRLANPVQFRGGSGPGGPKTTAYVLQQGTSQGVSPSSMHPNLLQNLQHADSNSSWPDSDCDPPQLQKNIMKWESDERLGLLSTISPVLYANINLPHLKIEFPAWTDRVKQIAKIWRGLPTEKRQPYLQRARENRAASRSQRSSSTDSERSVKEASKTQEVDQEKQWKQYHAIRMQHQAAQQRLIHEQRVRAALKAQTEKAEGNPAVAGENIKLFHSKSLSDIPQFPSTPASEESMQNAGKAKVFEKRWSSSAIDLNATETLLQGNKLTPENQAALQKTLMQERIASSLLHVSKVQSPVNSPMSAVPDAAASPSAVLKTTPESFQPAQSPVHTAGLAPPQKQAFSPQMNPRTAVLMNRPEAARVTTPTAQKEAVNTPPSTPRPHSSESFFQMSASPQSQLIASLDTHSQPTPARSKLVGPGNLFEGAPPGSVSPAIEVQNPALLAQSSKAPTSVTLGMTLQTSAPKPQMQQPVMTPVEHFVLQQASNFPASNIVKQLSQYKETFSPMTNTPEMGPMLPPEKSLEHQNLEQLLQTSQITLPFQNKATSHQHLRDLLQSKKAGESELSSTQEGKLVSNEQSTQEHLTSPGQLKLSNVLQDSPIETICSPGKLKLSDVLRDPPLESTSSPRKLKLSDVLRDPPIETTSSPGKLKLSDVLRDPPIETTSSPGKLKLSDVLRDPPIETTNSSGKLKLSDVLRDPPIAAESANQTFSPQQSSEKMDVLSTSDPQASSLADNERMSQFNIEDNCIPSQADTEGESGKKKKTTAADLVKDLETQQHDDAVVAGCNLDILPGDVGDLELDDDELLGLGNDFNILEYADPELDKSLVGEGEKSNILDEHLDLDDKDEELEDDVIKDDGTQDKDLIVQEITDEKKSLDIEDRKPEDINRSKASDLPENFLNFDKKDLDTLDVDNSFKPKEIASPSLNPMANIIKEEPKQAFSSCSLSSQTYSPTIDIKLEKGIADNCNIQKPPNITFNPETQTLTSQRPGIQVPEQLIPPPSYRMVTALKQTLGGHVPQNALPPQNKGVFPLHLNMNLRQDLPLNQPNVLSSPVSNTKPLLLQEQPLLLEDLVEQEKREQRRQNQESLISPHATDALLSDIDFERLKDDVFSGPPDDSLGGPGSLLGGHDPTLQAAVSSVGVPSSSGSHQFGPPPYSLLWQNQESVQLGSRPLTIMQNLKAKAPVSAVLGSVGSMPGAGVPAKVPTLQGSLAATRPFNPNFVPAPENMPVDTLVDPEKLKLINYEKYLMQQHALLGSRQKYFETEVMKLRKAKKALNAKQRQLRKNGSELAENDALELARVSQEQAGLQKQLEQARKQFRQNTVAVQDYRLKQQKRQQQQLPQQQQQQQQAPQSVPRSPLHTSVSSLQSSPQNSQSPLQFSQTAPQSPMMPASPVGPPNSVRIQHSPSPLMQSPVSVTSAVAQQSNVHSPLLSQQLPLQFQTAKSEGKAWPPNVKIQQGENIPAGERYAKRESFEGNLTPQTYAVSGATNSPLADINLKGLVEMKKSYSEDSLVKKIDSPSLSMNLSDDSFAGKPGQTQTLLHKDQKLDVESAADPAVPQSILSQSLPSSVSNTLKFTLRQTGMPTGCLPATDGASDNPSELAFSTPTPEIQSKISEPKPMLISAEKKIESKESQNIEASVNEPSVKIVKSGLTSTASESLLDNQAKSSTATVGCESNLTSERTQENGNKTDQSTAEKNLQQSLLRADVLANIKQEIIEDVPVSTGQIESADIKIEPGTTANQTDGSMNQAKTQDANEGSSDEELENISKSSAEKEREQAEQNVLLKQLLQNCPSADTPRKSDSSLI
ncbi:Histone-lysine N-methyltransferase 2D, partial [Araneus ventricosus]